MSFWQALWHFYSNILFGSISSSVVSFGFLSYVIPRYMEMLGQRQKVQDEPTKRKTPKVNFKERLYTSFWSGVGILLFNTLNVGSTFFIVWETGSTDQFTDSLCMKLLISVVYFSSILSIFLMGIFYQNIKSAERISKEILS